MAHPPIQLPGYEILEIAGVGGMATVWRARQISLDREVAIKFMSDAHLTDAEARDRFSLEARAAAKLIHPNIIQVYDAGEQGGVAYYIMEYVDGKTVGDWMETKGQLSENLVARIAEGVANALRYAWEKFRIIHCDIKPDNVMIERTGSIKVADLGLARIIGQSASVESDVVLGTPNYSSPEQARGDNFLDFRSDIYSLGLAMYHVLTGHLPFKESTPSEAYDRQIDGYLPDPLDLQPGLSLPMAMLVEKMTVKDPAKRYESWTEFLDDLYKVADGHMPAQPWPEEGAATVGRSASRSEAIAAAKGRHGPLKVSAANLPHLPSASLQPPTSHVGGVLVILVLLGAIGFTGWKVYQTTTRDPADPDPANGNPTPTEMVQPTPAVSPTPGPDRIGPVPTLTGTWDHPQWQRAVDLHDRAARRLWRVKRGERPPSELEHVEADARAAILVLERLRDLAPPESANLDGAIRQCYQHVFDSRKLRSGG